MGYTSSARNRDKEVHAYACRTILQRSDTQAVTDGRKQEGFILSLGKLPHRSFDTFVSKNARIERRGTPRE